MGLTKRIMEQEEAQGWRFSPGVMICHDCLDDSELVEYVHENAAENNCDFCERTTEKPCSVPFDSIMEIIENVIHDYYDLAVNKLGWDQEDQCYFGNTYDTWDLIRDDHLGNISNNEEVLQAITDAIGRDIFCDRHPYSTVGLDAYDLSWEEFCKTVKHHNRYFFNTRDENIGRDSDVTPLPYVLAEIMRMLEEHELVTILPADTPLTRVRAHKPTEQCTDWKTLGSPPHDRAPSNRMSAAGISMFYASTTIATATAEAHGITITERRRRTDCRHLDAHSRAARPRPDNCSRNAELLVHSAL